MTDHVRTSVEEYVRRGVQGFLGDPPDSDFQFGFLSALLVIAKEALGQRMDMTPFAEAQKLQRKRYRTGN